VTTDPTYTAIRDSLKAEGIAPADERPELYEAPFGELSAEAERQYESLGELPAPPSAIEETTMRTRTKESVDETTSQTENAEENQEVSVGTNGYLCDSDEPPAIEEKPQRKPRADKGMKRGDVDGLLRREIAEATKAVETLQARALNLVAKRQAIETKLATVDQATTEAKAEVARLERMIRAGEELRQQ
jgi:hypothetical protein